MKVEGSRVRRLSSIRARDRFLRRSSFVLVVLLFASCTERQQSERIQDVEPERLVGTDLTLPKNPQRWAYVGARVGTDPRDPFPGFRVVVANALAVRAREEGRRTERGAKFAQYVYEPSHSSAGIGQGALLRVNLIVQDSEKYASTGGWGFASFDGSGRSIPLEPGADCVVCHVDGPLLR
jgi:hypothetical protein